MIRFREAERSDVPAIVALLSDDALGATREGETLVPYYAAFDRIAAEGGNAVIVGDDDGRVIATYQLTFITGLSLRATRRAQIESVRVAAPMRGQGIGAAMFADAEARARAAGCKLMQLTMNSERRDARRFYEGLGFIASHTGFKRQI
ncbi:MAG: GNAT family N-acetyltransferase [Rhodobacteraceae bacterium]|nr:GNAT family N-acetyltransferase [Paracoccaceae bacterium]